MQVFNFLTHETLKSYHIEDTSDGFAITHRKSNGTQCRLEPRSDYLLSGFDFLELLLKHQMECGQ